MKKCPFCFEAIQDEAIKCRHCNEWIDKKPAGGLMQAISSTERFFKDKVNEYQEKQQAHLYWPTNDNPLKIKRISFFPDRFIYDDNVYFYRKIEAIYYLPSITTSIVGNDRTVTLMIVGVNDKDNVSYRITLFSDILKSINSGSINKKEFEQLNIAHELIAKTSFHYRISFCVNELAEKGYFEYDDNKFYANGDLANKKGKIVANLSKEFKEGNVALGVVWSNSKRSSTNPYEFSISSGAPKIKFLGLESRSKISFETIVNHDVFKYMLSHFQEYGKYPSNNFSE